MPKKQNKNQEERKEASKFFIELTILYWLNMIPLRCMEQLNKTFIKTKKWSWYTHLNLQFSGDDKNNFDSMPPAVIQVFLVEFIEEKKWKPEHMLHVALFEANYSDIKQEILSKKDAICSKYWGYEM